MRIGIVTFVASLAFAAVTATACDLNSIDTDHPGSNPHDLYPNSGCLCEKLNGDHMRCKARSDDVNMSTTTEGSGTDDTTDAPYDLTVLGLSGDVPGHSGSMGARPDQDPSVSGRSDAKGISKDVKEPSLKAYNDVPRSGSTSGAGHSGSMSARPSQGASVPDRSPKVYNHVARSGSSSPALSHPGRVASIPSRSAVRPQAKRPLFLRPFIIG